ncbi:MAG: hypothetical protein A3B68_00125 [Candidatus Melainabacteria bacterium RIFCSPHIGHO2_02_FULL_34_12]|nr:MAG: hypothetical protein A3B68_00125 [Candidatus Melainabacteria bacterium RIFCSPHIGHO2_02_FULL_34_12]
MNSNIKRLPSNRLSLEQAHRVFRSGAIKNKLIRYSLCLVFIFLIIIPAAYSEDNYPKIGNLENILLGMSSPDEKISDRLTALEQNVFGMSFLNDSLDVRTHRIKNYVLGKTSVQDAQITPDSKYVNNGFENENAHTKEISESEFIEILVQLINDERSFKGSIPLTKDSISINTAQEHAFDLLKKGYLTYFSFKNQGPDERYTLSGGTGALVEILKGFEADKNDKKSNIKLTTLLAKQLVQALAANTDDSQIFFNPYLTHIGVGAARSQDKKKFVAVIDFITKGGEFDPIKPSVNLGEKILVSGKINKPFKFKAVSIAYFEKADLLLDENNEEYIDNESIKPYFPPQSYIAFGDTGKGNLMKVLKGIGAIGAIGAAPFTGGATAVLAPVLVSSIQSGPPKEIPLKGGMKAHSDGTFHGTIELNYQGRSGLYFISVLAEVPGLNYPLVISRRTVRVENFLKPVAKK